MKIYTNITIIIRIMQKLFVRDIEGKEWMRGRGWRGRCNMVSTGGVDAICRGWTSVIYSRRTPEAAASPRELRNLPRTSSHGNISTTELEIPPSPREVERGNLAKFSCFLTNKRWPQIVPFSPGQTGIRMADAFYILPRLETGSVG